MNMQEFYQRLSIKPEQDRQRHLTGLTRASRIQILEATREGTWLLWWKPEETELA